MDTRIDKIALTNFRCFPTLTMTLDPACTVLVATNGGGKTAVLDALPGAACRGGPMVVGLPHDDRRW